MTNPVIGDLPTVPKMSWEEFSDAFTMGDLAWLQGEHVSLIGPTGSGKTTLAYFLLPLRKYSIVLATKPKSPSLTRFGRDHHYTVLKEWKQMPPKRSPKRIIWPRMERVSDVPNQMRVVGDTLNNVFMEGGWCLYIDELRYVTETLGYKRYVNLFLLQGRELGISLVIGSQRPAWIPLEVFDQATHLFFWNDRDDRNLSRISGISSIDTWLIRDTILSLGRHEFLYINTRTGTLVRSKSPDPSERIY